MFVRILIITLLRKRELVALTLIVCLVHCVCLCSVALPDDAVGLQYVIVVFPGHTYFFSCCGRKRQLIFFNYVLVIMWLSVFCVSSAGWFVVCGCFISWSYSHFICCCCCCFLLSSV